MKEIALTQGKNALVDDEDFEKLNQYKWYASNERGKWYAARRIPTINDKRKIVRMHRIIMNAPHGVQVDHRNNNGLFNCRENLRLCSNQQNGFNKKNPRKDNKLGIKGVCFNKNLNKFHARIMINGKGIHLGYYNVLGDADSAYRIAEEKYFGEFARCN